MKTKTILDALLKAHSALDVLKYTEDNEKFFNYRARQENAFYEALLTRIEAGDRAREQVANIVKSFNSHLYEEDTVMEICNMLRKDGIDV